ncbi:MAG: hypothetical protein WAZ19_16455 [Anaerolineae bacterium]
MTDPKPVTWIGDTLLFADDQFVAGEYVSLDGEDYYRIACVDKMSPFFMSLVSSADHWLFIASTGGLTAGRVNADNALFPYETEDKIIAHGEQTGGKTLVRVTQAGRTSLWEPFSACYAGLYRCERNLYKNVYGNKLVFEEINHDLQLMLRVVWRTGDRFGFVRTCHLYNLGEQECRVEILDGMQNILPAGATQLLQTTLSNLLNAYKRSELDVATGLGIFALSATLSDRAEPSESLKATVVWQTGLLAAHHLLSTTQLNAFRHGRPLSAEQDICGRPGAYFVHATLSLAAHTDHTWHMVADVQQDHVSVERLHRLLLTPPQTLAQQLEADIARGTERLVHLVAAADGLQFAAERTTTAHHFANVLFNIMRGGVFIHNHQVLRDDLDDFLRARNRAEWAAAAQWLADLPPQLAVDDLYTRARATRRPDLVRLCYEYLPLTFSRRHGDPSRPWNRFSIHVSKPDGSARFDYQGNWRDIFQNWEPLALSFPAFAEGMVVKFLDAMTADGYNPYRLTREGVEWETPEPENPWANIGYWSDHQVIYLQKLLEIVEQVNPQALAALHNAAIFSYADVPYRLRPYSQMLTNWHDTIEFDHAKDAAIAAAVTASGADARLLHDAAGAVVHVTLAEKVLVLLLAKLTNLVPEGGIWMNTQRPEWNDANNALVGKGLSVVTAAYLRRFIAFWIRQTAQTAGQTWVVNADLAEFFGKVQDILRAHRDNLVGGFSDTARRAVMDQLGTTADAYRTRLYQAGIAADQVTLDSSAVHAFLTLAQTYIEQTLRANRRDDGLYHSYNTLSLAENSAAVDHLQLMLEGQVALLSSGWLEPQEVSRMLHSLRHSDLYRADQHSYLLYPDRRLTGFREKNQVSAAAVMGSRLAAALAAAGDVRLLVQDDTGDFHFNGNFRNAGDAARVLDELAQEAAYAELVPAERSAILELFETTFNHRAFTGRSGTFFAYEGLGSIYWHMVAKLLLAVQERHGEAVRAGASADIIAALAAAYYDIRQGLGFNKSPALYGAFPTDPYSHTPSGSGARQPGMTGQVKEEILTRLGELGVSVQKGILCFKPILLRRAEFLTAPAAFSFVDVREQSESLTLPANSLAFTICQVPVIYSLGAQTQIEAFFHDGRAHTVSGSCLDVATSHSILTRSDQVAFVHVTLDQTAGALLSL